MKRDCFCLAIVPARGNSKGIVRKNLVPVLGKPLIHYSIDAACVSRGIDAVAVTSDDPEILAVARNLGVHAIRRPDELATDEAPMLPVIQHAVRAFEESTGKSVTSIVLLQPTSPLRRADDIEAAVALFRENDAAAVISVSVGDNKALKLFVENADGSLRGVLDDQAPFMRRQDLPRVLLPNGAIYVYEARCVAEGCMLPKRTLPYIMPQNRSVDVDVVSDIARVEALLAAPE